MTRTQYVSKWSDGTEIRAEIVFDERDGRIVSDIPDNPDDNGAMLSERVLLHHGVWGVRPGAWGDVCPRCRKYVLRPSGRCPKCI